MISLQQYRMSVGSFCCRQIGMLKERAENIGSFRFCIGASFSTTILSVALINVLLIIGGIEINPGPNRGIKTIF